MNKVIMVEQKAGIGSTTTQIAEQNNHFGMTSEEACRVALSLFMDNFPKLQQIAKETAEKRVEELCDEIIKKLEKEQIRDFSSFTDPDVQYVLLDAQQNYARFGTEELLSNLSDLIISRIKYDSDDYLKILIDKAISVVGNLTSSQINLLTVMFLLKGTKHRDINSLDDLKNYFETMIKTFHFDNDPKYSLLITLGCLELQLGSIVDMCASEYLFDKISVGNICPESIKNLHSDYGVSHVGKVIAIINYNNKMSNKLNIQNFL